MNNDDDDKGYDMVALVYLSVLGGVIVSAVFCLVVNLISWLMNLIF